MDYGQNQQGSNLNSNNNNPQYQQYSQYQQMPSDKRSKAMTTAATILSVIAMSATCCIYVSFICGILGIIFALLSKGGETTMSRNSQTALWISIFAIILTISLTIESFVMMIMQYGSLDAFWKTYMEMVETYSENMPY